MLGLGLSIPQVALRQRPPSGGGGGGAYVAKAVQTASNTAVTSVTTFADSPKRTISFWLNLSQTAMDNFPTVYGDNQSCVLAKGWNHTTDLGGTFYTPDRSGSMDFGTIDGILQTDVWKHHFIRVDVGHPAGEKIIDYYVNAVSVIDRAVTSDVTDTFTLKNNGTLFVLPDTTPNGYPMRYADFQLWSGQAIAPTGDNLAKFISGGKPVNPSVAATAFGPPDILLSGNASSFAASPFFSTKNLNVASGGSNGPGPVSVPGAMVGDPVRCVWIEQTGPEVTSDFESVVTVDDQVQQTGAPDYSSTSLLFLAGHNTLTNATTSPSD